MLDRSRIISTIIGLGDPERSPFYIQEEFE
jgi:hypothetical protein